MTTAEPIPLSARAGGGHCVLWIGSRRRLGTLGVGLGQILGVPVRDIVPVQISDIDAELMQRLKPISAFSMLTWIGGDVLEAARALQSVEFRGPYRAFGPPLPEPGLVEREVQQIAPGIDFAIVPAGSG